MCHFIKHFKYTSFDYFINIIMVSIFILKRRNRSIAKLSNSPEVTQLLWAFWNSSAVPSFHIVEISDSHKKCCRGESGSGEGTVSTCMPSPIFMYYHYTCVLVPFPQMMRITTYPVCHEQCEGKKEVVSR